MHPTLAAALGKAKIGGLVLAATVVLAGTAEAASSADLFLDDTPTVVQTEPTTPEDCPTEEPLTDPSIDPSDEQPASPTDEPTEEVTTETAPTDEPTAEPTDDPTGEPTTDACADAKNHGEYVSGVAKDAPPGPGHGAAVSEAARSDCGKRTTDSDSSDSEDPATSDTKGDKDKVPPGQAKKDDAAPTGNVPPGQAKKDDASTSEGSSSSPGSSSSGAPGNSGNAPGHNK